MRFAQIFASLIFAAFVGAVSAQTGKQASVPTIKPDAVTHLGTLTVERHGQHGAPVILIPGLASGTWVWAETIAALKEQYQVYAVTLAGFDGRPAVKDKPWEKAQQSLARLIEQQKPAKPILIGHSLGGTLALLAASQRPDSVTAVVLVDALPVFPSTESLTPQRRTELVNKVRAELSGTTQADFAARQSDFMRRSGVIDETVAEQMASRLVRSDRKAVAEYAAAVMALDLRPSLGKIKVPVLEVVPYYAADYGNGGFTEASKRAYYQSLLTGISKLEVVTIPQSRHFVMLDQPQTLHQHLKRFLLAAVAK